MMNTAKFVRASRHKLKLTQAELAAKVGKERRSIMRYEQGDDLPPSVRLAIKHLLTEDEKKNARSATSPQSSNRRRAMSEDRP